MTTIVAIDARYLIVDEEEIRLAVSFGPNLTIRMAGQLLAPTRREGTNVFGLHNVVTKGNDVRIVDRWVDSVLAREDLTAETAVGKAQQILAGISDEDYFVLCEFSGDVGGRGSRPLESWNIDMEYFDE